MSILRICSKFQKNSLKKFEKNCKNRRQNKQPSIESNRLDIRIITFRIVWNFVIFIPEFEKCTERKAASAPDGTFIYLYNFICAPISLMADFLCIFHHFTRRKYSILITVPIQLNFLSRKSNLIFLLSPEISKAWAERQCSVFYFRSLDFS